MALYLLLVLKFTFFFTLCLTPGVLLHYIGGYANFFFQLNLLPPYSIRSRGIILKEHTLSQVIQQVLETGCKPVLLFCSTFYNEHFCGQ